MKTNSLKWADRFLFGWIVLFVLLQVIGFTAGFNGELWLWTRLTWGAVFCVMMLLYWKARRQPSN